MKRLKIHILLVLILGSSSLLYGQSKNLSLEDCYSLAKENYPKIQQQDLIRQSTEFSVDNVNKRYLPQISVNGQATYQSDVTQLPFAVPGITVTPISKDQYKLYGELNQPITDLFTVKKQKDFASANGLIEQQQVEIELYTLKERINQLYFGILLTDAQLKQTAILKEELKSSNQRLSSAIENGVALKSNLDLLEIENIKADQRIIELKSSRAAYLQMLGAFINQELNEDTQLSTPAVSVSNFTLNRPELGLFASQRSMLDIQSDLATARNIPHLGFFFQGGYGRPALNFLSNKFDAYYITGLRLNWSISGLYTLRKEKKIISLNQRMIDVQKETFEFNTNLLISQQSNDSDKMKQLLNGDAEIITLHEKVIKTANTQLENGDITTLDYLSTLHALDQARLNQTLHEVQLRMIQSKLQITTGN